MNPRLVLTASLLPLAALAAAIAPALKSAGPLSDPEVLAAYGRAQTRGEVSAPAPPTSAAEGEGEVHLSVTPDRSVLFAGGDRRMRVRVDWWADAGELRTAPTDLVVVVDRSGSMDGDKIRDARAAAAELVSQLGPEDRFGLVSFASDVRVDIPLSDSRYRSTWTELIERLESGGGTGMVEGLSAGLSQIAPAPGRSRRVVLISDGRPDTAAGLEGLAASAARGETPLSSIGIGLDYDEALMQSLADRGAGNFYWVQQGPELQKVLASELSSARETVASGIRLTVTGGARIVDAGGLPVGEGVELGTLYAGQRRSLWLTVEVPAASGTFGLGTFGLAYSTPEGAPASLAAVAPAVTLTGDPKIAFGSLGDTWAESVVTEDYNRLRTAVSASVQAGDRQAAVQAIQAYRKENELINAYAQNPAIVSNFQELDTLQREVEQQFVGEDQRSRQNLWSKGTRVDAYSKRQQR